MDLESRLELTNEVEPLLQEKIGAEKMPDKFLLCDWVDDHFEQGITKAEEIAEAIAQDYQNENQ